MKIKRLTTLVFIAFSVSLIIMFVPGSQITVHSEYQLMNVKKKTKSVIRVSKTISEKKCALTPKFNHIQTAGTSEQAFIGSSNINQEIIPVSTDPTVQMPQQSNEIYLTFDDGPNDLSDELLTLLDQYNAKATFFMIDGNMRRHPEAVKQMVTNGHSVGLHSVTHDRSKFYLSSQSVITEMHQTRNTLKEITGVDTLLIRTPYGSAPYMTDEYKNAVNEYGFLMWDWNIDSKDWYYRDSRLVSSTIAQIDAKKLTAEPLVILFHERRETYYQLKGLLDYLSGQQYVFKTLDQGMAPVQF